MPVKQEKQGLHISEGFSAPKDQRDPHYYLVTSVTASSGAVIERRKRDEWDK
jgi:hypothetical protein